MANTINTTVPDTILTPGAYSEFDFTSATRSLVPLALRIAVIAEMLAAGSAVVETPTPIYDANDSDTKLGAGSLASIICKTGFVQGGMSGATPQIFACPMSEPGGGVKAVETITVTVTTAQAGDVKFTIAGRLIVAGVNAGDAQNAIAAAIKAQLDAAKAAIPFTAGVAANVVTCTHTTKGVNGNDAAFALVSAPAGVTVAFVQTVAGAGAASPTNALNALYDQDYDAVILSNHTTTDVAALVALRLSSWSYTTRSYRFFGLGENGSLGTAAALTAAANDFGIFVLNAEKAGSLPGELAMVGAIAEWSRTKPSANLDGEIVAIYPPPPSYAYIGSEVESALSDGITPLVPSGQWMKIVRFMTTQTTVNSAPFTAVRDIAYPRTAAYRAKQYEINYDAKFAQATDTDDFKKGVRRMAIGIDRAMEAAGILRDVDSFLGQFQTIDADAPEGRVITSAPFRVAGPVHQSVTRHTMYS